MNVQLKKGALELCVLCVLARKDCYGYELVQEISRHIHISEGTIYPLLKRLKDEGYFTTYLKESTEGPPRKYYSLTKDGHLLTKDMIHEWYEFSSSINRIIEEVAINE